MANITRERVFQVADELAATGRNPTLAAVRKELGGGSFTTISEAMTAWKSRQAVRTRSESAPLPSEVTGRFTELAGEVWALALELADKRLAGEREAFEQERARIVADGEEAAELANQVTAELEAMKGRVAELEAALAAERKETATLREQFARQAERTAAAEARAQEIEKRADDLNAELARVNRQNGELVKALADTATGGKNATRARKTALVQALGSVRTGDVVDSDATD
jgi:chromosome segregation ATPase